MRITEYWELRGMQHLRKNLQLSAIAFGLDLKTIIEGFPHT
jgi:hypothetical protein